MEFLLGFNFSRCDHEWRTVRKPRGVCACFGIKQKTLAIPLQGLSGPKGALGDFGDITVPQTVNTTHALWCNVQRPSTQRAANSSHGNNRNKSTVNVKEVSSPQDLAWKLTSPPVQALLSVSLDRRSVTERTPV